MPNSESAANASPADFLQRASAPGIGSQGHAFAEHARAIGTRERTEAQRITADVPAIWNRFQLRLCVALADGVREILDESATGTLFLQSN